MNTIKELHKMPNWNNLTPSDQDWLQHFARNCERIAREERDVQWRKHLNAVLGSQLYKLHEKHFHAPQDTNHE